MGKATRHISVLLTEFFDFTGLRSSYEKRSTGSGQAFLAQDDQEEISNIEQGIQNLEVEIAALRSQ